MVNVEEVAWLVRVVRFTVAVEFIGAVRLIRVAGFELVKQVVKGVMAATMFIKVTMAV